MRAAHPSPRPADFTNTTSSTTTSSNPHRPCHGPCPGLRTPRSLRHRKELADSIVPSWGGEGLLRPRCGTSGAGPTIPRPACLNPGFQGPDRGVGAIWPPPATVTLPPADGLACADAHPQRREKKLADAALRRNTTPGLMLQSEKMPEKGLGRPRARSATSAGGGGGDLSTARVRRLPSSPATGRGTPGAQQRHHATRAPPRPDKRLSDRREMQILDNDKHADGKKTQTRASFS